MEENTVDILGVHIPAVTIPVKPGRNLAVIIEVAAMNQRQKLMGINTAVEFARQIDEHLENKAEINRDADMFDHAMGQDYADKPDYSAALDEV